jgi:hypothetical protein
MRSTFSVGLAATVLDVEVRGPGTKHSLSLQQVERWLDGATSSPNEAVKKARLKMLLVSVAHKA